MARRQMARDHVDEGRLAGAVGTNDTNSLLCRHVDRNIMSGNQRAEGLFHLAHGQDRSRVGRSVNSAPHGAGSGHGTLTLLRRSRVTSEPRPFGRNRMVTRSTEPRAICHNCGMTSTAKDRALSNNNEPTKAAATEPAPARMVTKRKSPDVVQYDMLGSTCPMVSAASAPPRPPRMPAIMILAWITRVTETPRNSTRISLSRI